MSIRRFLLAMLMITVALPLTAITAQGQTTATSARRDSISVVGYNFEIGTEADVIVRDPNTALRIDYTAGAAFTDGTVRVLLPRSEWRGDLHPAPYFTGEYTFSPVDRGAVSVLPAADLQVPEASCTGRAGVVPFADTTIKTVPGFRAISVAHVSCLAGSHLTIRIKGLTAPTTPVPAVLPVVRSASGQLPRISVGVVNVRPVPKVVLRAHVRGSPTIGQIFDVVVKAIGPADDVAGYSAHLAVAPLPENCTVEPRPSQAIAFLPGYLARPQTIGVSLNTLTTQRLLIYDPTNSAVPAFTQIFTVGGDPRDGVCPASFH